ncbi:mediator of RNA polymerase II transcription subunit 26-like [Mizuhopecten yessoensis]|uniref:Mediator of RNA polymerase II transcription subunit 26 n=1 Tax=Mizuhopecten yessoensis TaxID=6573 RepID=A0A210QBV7_MIZYE|nr:mediator of RNA polymerase II transcription subunit 26-like [Mizuhopecten yessoensis]OWF46211.1 Mediator of RNA polymerase II transcription subunit 26 [Mizuhopecten yessoensis]
MQCTPVEIKEKLLKALDEDNNVVDMAGVLAVITVLETYPITREALEQTRIGRTVNELRRKTSNDQLAKRAKKLVRNWQKLISATPQSDHGPVNGDKDNGETIARKHTQWSSLQGGDASSCPNSPAFPQKLVSPALNRVNAQNASVRSSPSKSHSVKPTTPNLQLSQRIKSKPSTPKLPQSPATFNSKPNTPNQQLQQRGRSKPNTPNLPQNSKMGQSPNLIRTDSPKYCLNQKIVNSPKVSINSPKVSINSPKVSINSPKVSINSPKVSINSSKVSINSSKVAVLENSSRAASPSGSIESSLGRPLTPSECGSTSRPLTPQSVCNGPEQSGGRLPRNLSHESLSNSSIHNNTEERHQNSSNHSSDVPLVSKTVSPPKAIKATKPDQSLNVKTNVANKKRSREDVNGSGHPSKIARMQNSDNCSGSYKKAMNGSLQSTLSSIDASLSEIGHSPSASTPDGKGSFSNKRNVNLLLKTDTTPKVTSEKATLSGKTPKVKTTAQLIADLQAKSGSAALGRSVIRDIETNQIHKESDVPDSVLPPGVGKKRRLKPDTSTPIRSHLTLSKTKTELVEKFLQTSVTPNKYEINKEESPYTPGKYDSSLEVDVTNSSGGDTSFRPAEVKQVELADTESNSVPTEERVKPLTLEEAYNLLPPIDYDNVYTEDAEDVSEPIPVEGVSVSDQDVHRVLEEQWEGVNGVRNTYGSWCDWTQTMSSSSYNGDVLHILPYVLIDE